MDRHALKIDTVFTRPATTTKLVDVRLFDSAVHSSKQQVFHATAISLKPLAVRDTFSFSRFPRLTSSLIDMGRKWCGIMKFYPPELASMCIPSLPKDLGERSTGISAALRVMHKIAAGVSRTETAEDALEAVFFDFNEAQILNTLLLVEEENLAGHSKE